MLETERKFYSANLVAWAQKYPQKVVLVKGESLIGAYDNMGKALEAGVSEFGLTPFLARPVGQPEQSVSIPALTLGLLNASTQHTTQR